MKILCIGDSNTWGYDPRSFFGSRYPADVRWTDQLNDHTVINCGMNGLSVPQNAAAYRELIKSRDPELMIVMLGSNDLLQGASAEIASERMNSFLREIRDVSPATILISPPSMQMGEWVQSKKLVRESKKLGPLYRKNADSLGIMFADADDWQIELSYDGVHFTEKGHASFAESLKRVLRMITPSQIK